MPERAAVFCLLILSLAAAGCGHDEPEVRKVNATITAWDPTARSLSLEGKLGTKRTFEWDDRTEIIGEPEVGNQVRIRWIQNEDETRVLLIRALREGRGKWTGKRAESRDSS